MVPTTNSIGTLRTAQLQVHHEDPHGFLDRYRPPVIIDEVQRVPDLLSAIQVAVDRPEHTGNYILTGSQNLLMMRDISQSLAGRTGVLHLLPLSSRGVGGTGADRSRSLRRPVRQPGHATRTLAYRAHRLPTPRIQ